MIWTKICRDMIWLGQAGPLLSAIREVDIALWDLKGNQVGIWFNFFRRKALREACFKCQDQLRNAIEAFVQHHHQHAHQFRWCKREVKGSHIRNTIIYQCS